MSALVGSPHDVDVRFLGDIRDVQFVEWTSADQTVPEVDDLRAFILQPFSFGEDTVGFSAVTAATGIEAHEFDGAVPLKLPGLVPQGRETVEPGAVRAVGVAPDDPDLRRHGHTRPSGHSSPPR